jgi:drug/metabolite transporter (DMT)-like permease
VHNTGAAVAISLLIASQWVLSTLDASGKWLATAAGLPVLVIAFFRYVVHLLLALGWSWHKGGFAYASLEQPALQLLRGLLMLATTLLFFSTLRMVPLAEATAMNFLAPIVVVACAPWLLNEAASKTRWIAVLIAFSGMLIVVRPTGNVPALGLLLGLVCALCFAGFQIVTRKLRDAPQHVTNLVSGAVGTVGSAAALPWTPLTLPHTTWIWVVLISTGLSGFIGHQLQIAAYRRAEASLLSPFIYLQILAATVIGYLVFGQIPDSVSALGMVVIVLGGVVATGLRWPGRGQRYIRLDQ